MLLFGQVTIFPVDVPECPDALAGLAYLFESVLPVAGNDYPVIG